MQTGRAGVLLLLGAVAMTTQQTQPEHMAHEAAAQQNDPQDMAHEAAAQETHPQHMAHEAAEQQTHPQHMANEAAAKAEADHHAYLQAEREAIERGEGFGMALAADNNGYPGPKHALDMKKELKLTATQEAAMQTLMAQMKEKALAKGKDVLAAEARLEELFAQGKSEDELREETYRVASLRAELRWVHLAAHIAARKILTPTQIAEYQRLRHAAGK